MKRKGEVVDATTKGVAFLFRKNKITSFQGTGRIDKAGAVSVVGDDGAVKDTLATKNILIASGSEVTPLPGVTVDEKKIVSSTGALELAEVPKHLVVVGAGIIGLELGSVWRRLGSDVTVIEFLDRITPGVDDEITKHFQRALAKQGLTFKLGSKVTKADASGQGVTLTVEPAKGGAAETVQADIVLVCIGRRPFVEGLGLDKAGVKLTRARPHRGRCAFPDLGAGHLRHRRRDRRPDAGAQGERGRRRLRRDHRRPEGPCELGSRALDHLHPARGGVGRQDRGTTQGSAALPTRSASIRSPPIRAAAPTARRRGS